MQIEDFKKAKRQLEQDIWDDVHRRVNKFEKDTGYSPMHIEIAFGETCSITADNKRTFFINGVHVGIDMKATIKKQETFDFEISGKTYTGFKKGSTWNGLVVYENNQGTIIVTEGNRFEELVFGAFNQEFESKIIQCSPCFVGVSK